MTPSQIVLAAMAAIFTNFDADAARDLLAPSYIQHNPAVPTGAAPILGFIPGLEASGITVTTHRVIAQGDYVVLHNSYDNAQALGAEHLVAFDVFRVENGQIAEHWDNLQEPPAQTVSGRSMTDGPTQITDRDQTEANRALVEGFVTDILQGAHPDRITNYVSTQTYHQHNPLVGDGLDGLGAAFAALAENGQAIAYSETPIIVAEGNFVFTASQGTMGTTPTAFFDLFRIENGRIVEHWDTISAIPDEMAHDNGKF